MSLWKWFGSPFSGQIDAGPSLFTIIKAVADEYFDKKKECNDDDDRGRIDDVAD